VIENSNLTQHHSGIQSSAGQISNLIQAQSAKLKAQSYSVKLKAN